MKDDSLVCKYKVQRKSQIEPNEKSRLKNEKCVHTPVHCSLTHWHSSLVEDVFLPVSLFLLPQENLGLFMINCGERKQKNLGANLVGAKTAMNVRCKFVQILFFHIKGGSTPIKGEIDACPTINLVI